MCTQHWPTKHIAKLKLIKSQLFMCLQDVNISSTNYSLAITPSGNKAFIHWVLEGTDISTGLDVNLFGLDLLVVDEQGLVKEILALRQPLPAERQRLIR